MKQSSTVGQTILFYVQFCNGHASLIGSGHTWANNIAPSDGITLISLRNHWRRLPRLRTQQSWHTLPLLWYRNGNVPNRGTSVHHHAHRQMVEQHLFALYLKAGQAVLPRCCKENANALIDSNDPRRRTLRGIKQRSPAAQPS